MNIPPGGRSLIYTPANNTRHDGVGGAAPMTVDQLVAALTSMGADVDVSFIVLAKHMTQLDRDIADRIKGLDSLSKLTDALNTEMQKVKNLKAALAWKGGNGDDTVDLVDLYQHMEGIEGDDRAASWHLAQNGKTPPGGMLDEDDITRWCNQTIANDPKIMAKLERQYGLKTKSFSIDARTGGVVTQEGGSIGSVDGTSLQVTKEDVDKYEQQIQGEINKASTGRELATIGLNAVISKKGQIAQMLSNIQKKEHDTQAAIIGNMR